MTASKKQNGIDDTLAELGALHQERELSEQNARAIAKLALIVFHELMGSDYELSGDEAMVLSLGIMELLVEKN